MVSLTALVAGAGTGCAVQTRSTLSPRTLHVDVLKAETTRDGLSPAIRRALVDQDPKLRIVALRALARIEETGTAGLVLPLLGDPNVQVARWSAFAAGQIGDPTAETGLRQAVPDLSAAPVAVVRAMGRAGSATTARDLKALLGDPRAEVRAGAALALGLMAKRLGEAVNPIYYGRAVHPLVTDPDVRVRFGAVYALLRMPGPVAAVSLVPALGDPDPEIRAHAVRGVAASAASIHVLDAVLRDPDWRVRVEVAKELGDLGSEGDERAQSAAAQRLQNMAIAEADGLSTSDVLASGRTTHVLLAVIDASLRISSAGQQVIDRLGQIKWRSKRFAGAAAPDAARIHCALAFALDNRDGVIRRVRGCGDTSMKSWRRKEYEIRLLGRRGPSAVEPLLKLAKHSDPRVRTAAVSALGELEFDGVDAVIRGLLTNADPYVVAAAATAIASMELDDREATAMGPPLAKALQVMLQQDDANFAVAVLDAIAALGEVARPMVGDLAALAKDPRSAVRRRASRVREAMGQERLRYGTTKARLPYRRPPAVGGRVKARLNTRRGPVTLELYGDVAPRTVGAFVANARAGYYDNLTFHRVVPDFVAQGGCPRGDGWGGPGYTLESETSPLPFARGAVGIATNGRDTGGSQFFIMHSYHPHLDGGYTVFGRVIAGIDVVDALQRDDIIESVEVMTGRQPKQGVQ